MTAYVITDVGTAEDDDGNAGAALNSDGHNLAFAVRAGAILEFLCRMLTDPGLVGQDRSCCR